LGIDWEKCEVAPQKAQKVEGRILLDLRAKVNQLEHDLALSKDQLRKSMEQFRETQKKLTGREKSLVKITEKFSSAKKNLDRVAEQKLNVDIELTKLKAQTSELERQLSEAKANVIQLKQEFKFSTEKTNEMEQSFKFKDKMLETQKEDLRKRNGEIDRLKDQLATNQNENEKSIEKIKSLERQLAEVESSPEILEEIREAMTHKGFLSDKEFEKIIAKFE
jgi:chromosome segregation ATPase